jgi:hypothetical protein
VTDARSFTPRCQDASFAAASTAPDLRMVDRNDAFVEDTWAIPSLFTLRTRPPACSTAWRPAAPFPFSTTT